MYVLVVDEARNRATLCLIPKGVKMLSAFRASAAVTRGELCIKKPLDKQ